MPSSLIQKVGSSSRARAIESRRLLEKALAKTEPKIAYSIKEAIKKSTGFSKSGMDNLTRLIEAHDYDAVNTILSGRITEALSAPVLHPAAKRLVPKSLTVKSTESAVNTAFAQYKAAAEAFYSGQKIAYTEEQLLRFNDMLSGLANNLDSDTKFAFVFDKKGRVVGGITYAKEADGSVKIYQLFSNTKGVGSGLVGQVIRENPTSVIRLTSADNARSFYEAMGATPVGRRDFEFTPIAIDQAVTEAYIAGGSAGVAQIPKAKIIASLDLTNPQAVEYLRTTLPTRIVEITEQTREAVRAILHTGFVEGIPAPKMARVIRNSVGLTTKQAQAVYNFRRQLETGMIGNGKAPWDRRLSASERAQARNMFYQASEGKPAPVKQIDAIVDRYHESLVNRRSRNIARTESTRAFGAGKTAIWDEATRRGYLDPSTTRRRWIITPDERLREEHAAVPGMNKNGVGLNEPFMTPIGPVMGPRESGDPGFDVNCRCDVYLEIDE